MKRTTPLSLLYPENIGTSDSEQKRSKILEETAKDLEVKKLSEEIGFDSKTSDEVEKILFSPLTTVEEINYRLDVIQDLLSYPEVFACWEELIHLLQQLKIVEIKSKTELTPLQEVAYRLVELEYYIQVIQALDGIFTKIDIGSLSSEAIKKLHSFVVEVKNEPVFDHITRKLPELREKIDSLSSITIGVNLNNELEPYQATLLSVHERPFEEKSTFLDNLLKGDTDFKGLAELHSAPTGENYMPAILVPLFRDLSNISHKIIKPVSNALKAFTGFNCRALTELRLDFCFYIGAVRLIKKMESAGLPMCRPDILHVNERNCSIEELYNINLALHFLNDKNDSTMCASIVKNDFVMDDEGRIIILTGPNRGGKTTFLQAIGLGQIMAQAGLYVPGKCAGISPVDTIYTHYPVEEKPEKDAGRLGEESSRLKEIFEGATRHSLLLLNESLASTSPGESLYLAVEVVRIFRLLGIRAVFATHIHELGEQVDTINSTTEGDSRLISMISQVVENEEGPEKQVTRTFRIVKGKPIGYSYAKELACKYGVSYDQLKQLLSGRGII